MYNVFRVVILDSSDDAGQRFHLNVKVRDLRDIRLFRAALKKFLKNLAARLRHVYSA
jgi:hypothetical protein